jgi:U3 small nucleolar RNA-associated protein 11
MLSARNAQQGKHGAREGTSLSQDTVKLLKTQDAGYLRTVGERIRREMERLEKQVQLQDGMEKVLGNGNRKRSSEEEENGDGDEDMFDTGIKRRKLIFAETRADQKELGRELDEDDGSEEDEDEDNDEAFGTQLQKQPQQKQPTKTELEAQRKAFTQARAARKLKRRAAEARRNKLAALRKQYAEITTAERELDLQRAKMSNSVGGVNKKGVKWKIRERKR